MSTTNNAPFIQATNTILGMLSHIDAPEGLTSLQMASIEAEFRMAENHIRNAQRVAAGAVQ